MVSVEALILSLLIDVYEGCDVTTAKIVGTFLLANMDDEVIVKFESDMVDIMLQVDRETYQSYITVERGEKYCTSV